MRVFFIVCCVCGAAAVCGLMVLMFVFRLKINLAVRLPKGKTIPIEEFVPRSIYGLSVYIAVFGGLGLLLEPLLPWYFLIPTDILFSMIVNFIGAHFFLPVIKNLFLGKKPKPDDLTGTDAVTLDFVAGDGYGQVKVKQGDRTFIYDCISANHTDLKKNETVTVITGQDNLLFVQKKDEIYNVLTEKG